MEGEGKQRKEVQGVIRDKVKGEAVLPFTFPKQRNAGKRFGLKHLEYLQDHILQLLEDNKQLVCKHTLMWHFFPSN